MTMKPRVPGGKLSPRTAAAVARAGPGERLLVLAEFRCEIGGAAARAAAGELGLEVIERRRLRDNVLLVRGDAGAIRELANLGAARFVVQAPDYFAAGDTEVYYLDESAAQELAESDDPPANATFFNEGWDGPGQGAAALSYYFGKLTVDLPADSCRAQLRRAMQTWANHVAVTWTPASTAGQLRCVEMQWLARGDLLYTFDGAGGLLARSYFPPPSTETYAGDIEFDDEDRWKINAPAGPGMDLFSVALHELGHSLGLSHSDNPKDVMYYAIASTTVYADLAAGDIEAIQAIYAPALPAPPAAVTSWASVSQHGEQTVAADMTDGYVEPRRAGLRTVRVSFDQALDPATLGGGPLNIARSDGGAVSTAGATWQLGGAGLVLTVTLAAPLPDGERYAVAVAGTVRTTAGGVVAGDIDVTVAALAGDVDGSGTVDAGDVLGAQGQMATTVTAGNCRYDLDGSGAIGASDLRAARLRMGQRLP